MSAPDETSNVFDAREFLRNLTARPGVYRMLNAESEVIYVGKASNLKKRVSSYFRERPGSAKTAAMMKQVARVEVTITSSEAEALLLEYNQIKQLKPRFNILLRDDKSFPYLHIGGDHDFPRLSFYRGSTRKPGRFFGPYPSAHAVRETLNLLQKLFRIRPCEDSFFANRSRPCLQYQIERCSAPCVGLIGKEDYAADIDDAVKFLEGKNKQIIDRLGMRMEAASEQLEFEAAARYRDQIAALKRVDQRQYVAGSGGDTDVLAISIGAGLYCVAVMFVRGGRSLGSRSYFPTAAPGAGTGEVLAAFISQFYIRRDLPAEIITSDPVDDVELLEKLLGERAGRRLRIRQRVRGDRAHWLELARTNAAYGIETRRNERSSVADQLEELKEALGLEQRPERLECFDVSHSHGEATVASCVVFGTAGPLKNEYRRFNIKGLAPGDDYGAMRQALTRRYTRLKKGEAVMPDVLLVDGGKGQLGEAVAVLEELQIDNVELVAVAKGPSRRPGAEQLFLRGQRRPSILPSDSRALHLIQRIRDEAHRFAIGGHRMQRARSRNSSVLESIAGLGPKKRKELLKQFGGLQGVKQAGIDDLVEVRGISRKLASLIYETLHPES
ncbi:MAG: excinuclease ABC subunit C [Chromatiales bacterium]|nr:MAG: excinuclease ABC subunit C [Chromatiales bacterium]